MKFWNLLLITVTSAFCFTATLTAQEYDFKTSNYYYRSPGDTLISSGNNLASFNLSNASRSNDSLFTDGIYFPANDCFGRNLWIRLRHVAEDPNGTGRGINIPKSHGAPCHFSNTMLGGWAGFLYDFEILQDEVLSGTRSFKLGDLFPTSITVASLETLSGSCSGAEWLSFSIMNSGSTGWDLNSINFTGSNPNSNPGFSDSMAVYTTGGCTPPDGFSYTFPTGADSISFISASCCGYSEFKMSSSGVTHFRYGYEYSGQQGGYQGMSMAFGASPTFTAAHAKDVTCKNGNDGAISVDITGGAGPFTYEWSGINASGDSLNNLPAGTYTLKVIDRNGCNATAPTTFTITEPSDVSVVIDSIKTTHASCYGAQDGSIRVYASGLGGVTYHWDGSNDTSSIQLGLAAGGYSVTISDSASCLVARDTIRQPVAIDTSYTIIGSTITLLEREANYQWYNCDFHEIIPDSVNAYFTPEISGNYKAFISKDGCIDSTSCINITLAGLPNDLAADDYFTVSPNPSEGIFNLTWRQNIPVKEIEIIDLHGRRIYHQIVRQKYLNALQLDQSPGVYFMVIKTPSGMSTKKLLLQ